MRSILYLTLLTIFFSTPKIYSAEWQQCNNGLTNLNVWALEAIDNYLFAGTERGIFISSDKGSTWISENNGYNCYYANDITNDGSKIFVSGHGNGGGVFLSTNFGKSWSLRKNGLNTYSVFTIDADNNKLFAGSFKDGIFFSSDDGNTWSQRNNGLFDFDIGTIKIIGNDVFAGTLNGIYKSTNDGIKWLQKSKGLTGPFVYTIEYDGKNIFVGTDGGVNISTNLGETWIYKSTGITNKDVDVIKILGTNIIAGTWNDHYPNSGVFISEDYGDSWIQFNEGLTNFRVQSMCFDNKFIYVGTQDGIFKVLKTDGFPNLPIIEEPVSNGIQIFPNPIIDNIQITGLKMGDLIRIFDIFGNTVNETIASSDNAIILDFNKSTGIYFYIIKSQNIFKKGKLIKL